ncbi:hypothetical protein FD754_001207 [Muntiacus muntjak]|uniref:Zinc finger CCHC domain-containing protein 8 n=1 Tax=Muntiacus muntjak TaxID=9888 RepID=A0A5N3W5Z3_MUNMU|nr:hypothetical protein FD754_001207 [Muntiacus muntjak]
MTCGIFLNQGSNQCALLWQEDSEPLDHHGRPSSLLFTTLPIFVPPWAATGSSRHLTPYLAQSNRSRVYCLAPLWIPSSLNILASNDNVLISLTPHREIEQLSEDLATKGSKEMGNRRIVVGSVLYFTNFCLDKLGYQQVFSHIVSLEGQEIQVKAKRPKPHCFNCGSEEHQMKDCPMSIWMPACGETNNQNFQHEELQDALGVTDKSLPPFIYRMRQLGYPPGWLKEAELENSGLALYDGKDGAEGETEAGEVQQTKSVTYDLSKLVNYPGFNISTPRGIPDEWRIFGSIPMQACQQKDVFANYLTSNFQAPSMKSSSKRSSSQSSPSSPKKQKKENSAAASPADMELDSGIEPESPESPTLAGRFLTTEPSGKPIVITPKEYTISIKYTPVLLPLPTPIYFLSNRICQFWIIHLYGLIQYVAFCVWFPSHSIIFLRFTYIVASVSTSLLFYG